MVDSVLVPLCPSQSLTSVRASQRMVASVALQKAKLDPAGEFVLNRQLSRAWQFNAR